MALEVREFHEEGVIKALGSERLLVMKSEYFKLLWD